MNHELSIYSNRTKGDLIGFIFKTTISVGVASPVVLVHADALSSGDELLDFCHAVALPRDLASEQRQNRLVVLHTKTNQVLTG